MKQARHCKVCRKQFYEYPSKSTACCSRECGYKYRRSYSGANNPAWKGGRIKLKNGYVAIYSPGHPFASKGKNPWVYEHRLVMEKILGRYLEPQEVVHHKNGVKDDNQPENLELLESQSVHASMHYQNGRFVSDEARA